MWSRVLAATITGVTLLAGCEGDEDPETTSPAPRPPKTGERLDLDAPQNVRAGPLVLYHARQFTKSARSDFAPVRLRGRLRAEAPAPLRRKIRAGSVYYGVKLLAVIEGDRAVTLAIPRADRAHASLLYGRARRSYSVAKQELGLAEVSDGRAVVRLEPHARSGVSEIPGGLVVAGARCVAFDVRVEGSGTRTRRTIAFGRGVRC